MNAARRSLKRRDWPRGLDEPRPGYYSWRHPDGHSMAIGRVPFVVARNEALQANALIAQSRPGLIDRLTGAPNTIAALIDKMPAAPKPNTAKSLRSLDKIIRAQLGAKQCGALTVADCADLLEGLIGAGKHRTAEAVRSRLTAICRKGRALGWMDFDPASVTERPRVKVRRGRLTVETFRMIFAQADAAAPWLAQAMRLALVTGADVSTIAALQRAQVVGGHLTITRGKTGARVAIPLALRLDCMGWALAEVLQHRTGVVSRYLVHHTEAKGKALPGHPVHPNTISRMFTEARKLAGLPDDKAPTFHELRSLCKRLYDDQGNVDTKALLGHSTERMSDMYADPRGVEAIKVRIG